MQMMDNKGVGGDGKYNNCERVRVLHTHTHTHHKVCETRGGESKMFDTGCCGVAVPRARMQITRKNNKTAGATAGAEVKQHQHQQQQQRILYERPRKRVTFFFFISFFLLFRIHAHTSREKRIKNVIYRIVTCVCFVYTHTIGRDTLTRAYRISRRRVYTVGVQTRLYRSTEGEGEIIKKNFFFIYVKRKRGKKHAESAIFANFFFFASSFYVEFVVYHCKCMR